MKEKEMALTMKQATRWCVIEAVRKATMTTSKAASALNLWVKTDHKNKEEGGRKRTL